MAWVFQGNPKNFEIDEYLARYPELIYWRTPRYQTEISIGDRAIIWRSGNSAGAVAIGTVTEVPKPRTEVDYPEALGTDLWRKKEPDPNEPCTGIQLHEIRLTLEEDYLPREVVKNDAQFAKSTLITIPIGTVFFLDTDQTQTIERLWGLSPSSPTSAWHVRTEGDKKLTSHCRRERSRFLRDKKLDQIRELYGQCVCAICGIAETSSYPSFMGPHIFDVHHIAPLSVATTPVRTTLDDLAVICANCHRAVHATADVEANFADLKRYFDKSP